MGAICRWRWVRDFILIGLTTSSRSGAGAFCAERALWADWECRRAANFTCGRSAATACWPPVALAPAIAADAPGTRPRSLSPRPPPVDNLGSCLRRSSPEFTKTTWGSPRAGAGALYRSGARYPRGGGTMPRASCWSATTREAEQEISRRRQWREPEADRLERLHHRRPKGRPRPCRRRAQRRHSRAYRDRRRQGKGFARVATRAAPTRSNCVCGRAPASTRYRDAGKWYRDTSAAAWERRSTCCRGDAGLNAIRSRHLAQLQEQGTLRVLVEGDPCAPSTGTI